MTVVADAPNEDYLVEVPIRLSLAELERLTRVIDRARRSGMMLPSDDTPPDVTPDQLAAFAGWILTMRRRRADALPFVEFGEPAWDMLLDLYVQHVECHNVSVSNLCTAAAVPTTTALRWIEVMVSAGHFVRRPDPRDGRRVHVSLAPAVIDMLERYLTDIRQRALATLQ
jgi:hypothetical protein